MPQRLGDQAARAGALAASPVAGVDHAIHLVPSCQVLDAVDAAFDLVDAGVEEVAYDNPWLRPGAWYVVHTQSGYEKKVKANLEARIQSMNMEDKIYEIVIPMEEVDEFKNGKKQTVMKKVFPGYLLVRCQMDDETWYCVRTRRASPASSDRP